MRGSRERLAHFYVLGNVLKPGVTCLQAVEPFDSEVDGRRENLLPRTSLQLGPIIILISYIRLGPGISSQRSLNGMGFASGCLVE
jgi:hypothetical protein